MVPARIFHGPAAIGCAQHTSRPIGLRALLTDIAPEFLTDPDESAVDVAGSLSHASCGRQCNKRDNQEVLDQSLATLVVVKSLQQSKHSHHVSLLSFKD